MATGTTKHKPIIKYHKYHNYHRYKDRLIFLSIFYIFFIYFLRKKKSKLCSPKDSTLFSVQEDPPPGGFNASQVHASRQTCRNHWMLDSVWRLSKNIHDLFVNMTIDQNCLQMLHPAGILNSSIPGFLQACVNGS